MGWGGGDMGTSNWEEARGGGAGRVELAQILANFFVTALKARKTLNPYLREPGLEPERSLPQVVNFL